MRTLLTVMLLSLAAAAQQPQRPTPIQDNSFFLEEAYNQEDGVIQHISNFTRFSKDDWGYSFTEEIPVNGQKHQLSLTFNVANSGLGAGVSDALINYRYQLVGSGETPVAVSPRFSLIVPTGKVRDGRGSGALGFQANLPVSIELGKHFVTHWNAGGTYIPNAMNVARDEARVTGFNLGQSTIWLAHKNFNVLVETVYSGTDAVVGPERRVREFDSFVSPGVRWAHNFDSGLQIVPGVAVPVGFGSSAGSKGVVFYISFEHPFAPLKRK